MTAAALPAVPVFLSTDDLLSQATLTRSDLAMILQITPRSLDRLRQGSKFPKPIQGMGKFVRWSANAVKSYLEGGKANK